MAPRKKGVPVGEAALKLDRDAPLQGGTLGQRIRIAYLRSGMNRSRFAKALDVHYTTVLSWESDAKEIKRGNLERIAEVTGFSVDELLGRDARVIREPVEVHPSLEEYAAQRASQGRPLSSDRLAQLSTFRWKGGKPTVQSFAFLDAALDSTLPPEVAKAQAETTAAARARALARGGKPIAR